MTTSSKLLSNNRRISLAPDDLYLKLRHLPEPIALLGQLDPIHVAGQEASRLWVTAFALAIMLSQSVGRHLSRAGAILDVDSDVADRVCCVETGADELEGGVQDGIEALDQGGAFVEECGVFVPGRLKGRLVPSVEPDDATVKGIGDGLPVWQREVGSEDRHGS